jgi:hypothetical protein
MTWRMVEMKERGGTEKPKQRQGQRERYRHREKEMTQTYRDRGGSRGFVKSLLLENDGKSLDSVVPLFFKIFARDKHAKFQEKLCYENDTKNYP